MLRKCNRSPKAKGIQLESKWLVLWLTCLFFKHALMSFTLCILFIKSCYKTLKLHQITSLPPKYGKHESYLSGLTLLQVSPPYFHCNAISWSTAATTYFNHAIRAIHLSTSDRTYWGNATRVPRQKKFTSKASSRYYYSLVYFLTMP